jgi:hypothetical protein
MKSSRWPSRRERILALAKNLTDAIDSMTLEEIDGEFYWRICHGDLLEPVQRGMNGLETVDEVERLLDQLPLHVVESLARDERVRMREAFRPLLFTVEVPTKQIANYVPRVEIGIYSGDCKGDHLERLLVDWQRRWNLTPRGSDSSSQISVNFEFILVTDLPHPELEFFEESSDHVPVVVVIIHLPLPSEGVIGHAYDLIVRKERQWHLLLPGSGTKQEKEVALRTWAIALLMAQGEHFMDANREIEARTGRFGVSQARFGQDRERLIERVPEARPFLYVRGDRSNPL